jgi:hypothetical protein
LVLPLLVAVVELLVGRMTEMMADQGVVVLMVLRMDKVVLVQRVKETMVDKVVAQMDTLAAEVVALVLLVVMVRRRRLHHLLVVTVEMD